ncbi:PREDICTED: probable sodium/potassium/calcium exchanger CG1090 isoform X2 [Nicrophorus vespilloides]|nr:PREDICTED: probable sodium/potassium/calcium exchanger CG1090 isoform X2 [Nicrophorus vespilloides]XP_017785234.1 PREDICTED: probable sodium/potassium/calcium exchanger CG1090 isoform X2 [Nicrophorus vespilloides]
MRRTRRHKFLQISVFFMIYSIIHVFSDNVGGGGGGGGEAVAEAAAAAGAGKSVETLVVKNEASSDNASSVKTPPPTPSTTGNNVITVGPTGMGPHGHPTWRPKRPNCTPPAIEQFPKPIMGPWGRKHGGIIVHILVAAYTFIGLAIVCDEYFVASLDRICEELKLSPDVAGATFMAAGSSAPELATVIIGVFFANDDIGVSGVIGSAVFNIMFVISVCALCTSTVCYLNWWPLVRDCFFYALSILIMLFTIYNDTITWGESLFMLIMYVVYCIALHFNAPLERWAQTLPIPFKPAAPEEESGLVSYKTLDEDRTKRSSYGSPDKNGVAEVEQGYGGAGGDTLSGPSLNQVQADPAQHQHQQGGQHQGPAGASGYYRPKEADPNAVDPLVQPIDGTLFQKISWAVVFPIHYMCRKTIPDCKTEKYKNWYPFTFCVSMVWISFYSYFMVWMITIIGTTLGIPDTVMGLTFVAAGVSVPDALSSIAVIKEGYGDMAVSNAVGSNVFDILVCLGLPWFIQTAIIKPGSHVNVISKGLTYSTLSLLSTVVFLVVATHLNGWKLDKKLGVVLMIWYLIFITFASMYELNVFGQLNPPECKSLY